MPPLLGEVRPTVLTSVPRLYERAYLKVSSSMLKETPGKQKIFTWALKVGQKHATATQDRFVGPILGAQRAAANRLVYKKIKERFGGRLRFAISGGAPLSPDVARFFDAVGIRLFQGYGLSETAPVLAVNSPKASRIGSVGKAVEDVDLRIAEDGEILAKTPGLMKGYWENPEAHIRGDRQERLVSHRRHRRDRQGRLPLHHRSQEGSAHHQRRQERGARNPSSSSSWPIGRSHKPWWWATATRSFTSLIIPRFEELPAGLQRLSAKEIIEHSSLKKIIKSAVDEVNERLSDHERVRKFFLLDRELSLEDGEITPTLKVKRNVVMENYGEQIASMYLKTQKVS